MPTTDTPRADPPGWVGDAERPAGSELHEVVHFILEEPTRVVGVHAASPGEGSRW